MKDSSLRDYPVLIKRIEIPWWILALLVNPFWLDHRLFTVTGFNCAVY